MIIMTNKKLFLILMMTMLMLASLIPVSAADSSYLRISLVNQNPSPAVAGEIVEVRLGIENIGNEHLTNPTITFIPNYPFETVSGEELTQTINSLVPNQDEEDMQIIKFNIRVSKDAAEGYHGLTIDYEYEGSKGTKEIPIEIKGSESAEIIYIDKTVLIPGKEESLKFIINNVGNSPITDLTFSWINSDKIILPVGSDNTKYVSIIEAGENAEMDYKVIADTNSNSGLYELNLKLEYETSGGSRTIETIAGMYVGGGTDFEIAFSDSENGETSFTVANIGSNDASSVSVKIPSQEGWTSTGSNSQIIGNLNKGDYTIASFGINGKSKIILVEIDYTDTKGERLTVSKEIPISIASPYAAFANGDKNPSASKPTGTRGTLQKNGIGSVISTVKNVGIGILVLIISVVIWKIYKKNKKKLKRR